jgi:hypothetical protein
MRIWSLHPKYLDTKGLVAVWRETLLAKHVLEGNTKGYLNHPQLTRFKKSEQPLNAIHFYLSTIYEEALRRQYNFDRSKFNYIAEPLHLTVTKGQLDFELNHLLIKLETRDIQRCAEIKKSKAIITHPLFIVTEGEIEEWEIV